MKKIVSLFLIFSFLTIDTMAYELPNGKPVSVRLIEAVDSKNKQQTVQAVVDRDVKDLATGNVLIRRGTSVEISSEIHKAKAVGKPARIRLQCLSTKAVDGQTITLQGSLSANGESRKGLALGLGIGLGLWVWPAIFCLFIKGEAIQLPIDTLIPNVVVGDDYEISPR
ncbi:MAG: hypothetical protein IJC16_10420 [Rikenellaceae bacterium]|nr:hypothetical protein [Rikenellaceae bacterium]